MCARIRASSAVLVFCLLSRHRTVLHFLLASARVLKILSPSASCWPSSSISSSSLCGPSSLSAQSISCPRLPLLLAACCLLFAGCCSCTGRRRCLFARSNPVCSLALRCLPPLSPPIRSARFSPRPSLGLNCCGRSVRSSVVRAPVPSLSPRPLPISSSSAGPIHSLSPPHLSPVLLTWPHRSPKSIARTLVAFFSNPTSLLSLSSPLPSCLRFFTFPFPLTTFLVTYTQWREYPNFPSWRERTPFSRQVVIFTLLSASPLESSRVMVLHVSSQFLVLTLFLALPLSPSADA